MALLEISAAENSVAEISIAASSAAEVRGEEGNNNTQQSPPPSSTRIGKTCHQCRQMKMDSLALCKNQRTNNKPCPLTFCHKCLINRYGENLAEVGKLNAWICPKCRNVCNCSNCMKKKGFKPTGILAPKAKSTGFISVHELINDKDSGVLVRMSAESTATPKKSHLSNKGSLAPKMSVDKENQCIEQNETGSNEDVYVRKEKKKGTKRSKLGGSDETRVPDAANGGVAEARPPKVRKLKKSGTDTENGTTEANTNVLREEGTPSAGDALPKAHQSRKLPRKKKIVLPQGIPLMEVADCELLSQDVGAALQFLEFCNSFSEVLDIRKGQPECVLRDLTRGRVKRHGVPTHVEFFIKLLSLMGKNVKKGGEAWMQKLKQCIEESKCNISDLSLDFLDEGSSAYDNLEPSEKLKILNFLCDEVLSIEELRSWIEEVDKERRENKEKVASAKKEAKLLIQKVKDETEKAMKPDGEETSLPLAESDDRLSKLQAEAKEAHGVLASIKPVQKKVQRSDAVRTDYLVRESNGQIFWKLSGYNNRRSIMLQDIENWDNLSLQDQWFIYDEEAEKVVEKHIISLRKHQIRCRRNNVEERAMSDSVDIPGSEHSNIQEERLEPSKAEEVMESDSSDSPGSTESQEERVKSIKAEEGTKSDSSDSTRQECCSPEDGDESIKAEDMES